MKKLIRGGIKMKKVLSITLAGTLLLSACQVVFANESYELSDMTVYIDDEYIELENKVYKSAEDGEACLVPVRELCDYIGYDVKIDNDKVEISEGGECKNNRELYSRSASFGIGDNIIYIETDKGEDGIQSDKIESVSNEPVAVKINDEIYMSPYYFEKMLELKIQNTTCENKVAFNTFDYLYTINLSSPKYYGYFWVRNNDDIGINVNGKEIEFEDSKPFIDENGRTQIPVRELCEQMDLHVEWSDETKSVSISGVAPEEHAGGASYWFTIGEKQYRRNGSYYEMDTAAQIIDGKTYIPIRYLADAMNYNILYNPSSHYLVTLGYDYITMLSYMNKNKTLVMNELLLTDADMINNGEDNYLVYTTANKRNCGVNIIFEDDKLMAFSYIFNEAESAYEVMSFIEEHFNKKYGIKTTYPGMKNQLSEIDLENLSDVKFSSYSDCWNIDGTLGNEEDLNMYLRFEKMQETYIVTVRYGRDKNEHSIQFMDHESNVILDANDILSCEAKHEILNDLSGEEEYFLEIKLKDSGREKFRNATKRISELEPENRYISILVMNSCISAPRVSAEIDSDTVIITGAFTEEEAKSFAEIINVAL